MLDALQKLTKEKRDADAVAKAADEATKRAEAKAKAEAAFEAGYKHGAKLVAGLPEKLAHAATEGKDNYDTWISHSSPSEPYSKGALQAVKALMPALSVNWELFDYHVHTYEYNYEGECLRGNGGYTRTTLGVWWGPKPCWRKESETESTKYR